MKFSRLNNLAATIVLAVALPLAATGLPAQAQDDVQPVQKKAKAAAVQPDGEINGRLDQLEEQLVDMQAVVGTIESLARGKGLPAVPAASGGGIGADGGGRLARLEGQVQKLIAEVRALSIQVQAMGGKPVAPVADAAPAADEAPALPGFGPAEEVAAAPGAGDGAASQGGGDGQIGDQIGTILTDPVPSDGSSGDGSSGGDGGAVDFSKVEGSLASAAPAVEPPVAADNQVDASVEPEKAYETAYGFLLQQDYDSAERAFTSFLGQFPADKLAGNAQYWLGETHYVRGQYGPAAQAFLKGYSGFKKGPKAPDSLLKLAMSLSRLGQKEQSCASFTELNSSYPALSAQLKKRATAERERAGCAAAG